LQRLEPVQFSKDIPDMYLKDHSPFQFRAEKIPTSLALLSRLITPDPHLHLRCWQVKLSPFFSQILARRWASVQLRDEPENFSLIFAKLSFEAVYLIFMPTMFG
jgi:hypothetical protein